MLNFLLVIDVLIAIGLIALILLQRGPGATAGAAFGGGASGTVFGARGSANFLSRSTGALAAAFFIVTLVMAMIASRQVSEDQSGNLGVMSSVPAVSAPADEVPAVSDGGIGDAAAGDRAATGGDDAAAMEAMSADVPVMSGEGAATGDGAAAGDDVPAMMRAEPTAEESAAAAGAEDNDN